MRYLLFVVEEGSFTGAAARLGISQAALSRQIQSLERALGQPLLERLPRAVRLTPVGRAYLPHAAAAVRSAADGLVELDADGIEAAIELRISALYSVATGILPPAIASWRASYPAALVDLREFANSRSLVEYMDLGFSGVGITSMPVDWSGAVHLLGSEELVVALATDDPAARGRGRRRARIDLGELAERQWVLYTQQNGLTELIERGCRQAGFVPQPAVRTRHSAAAAQLAVAGLGPALIPESIVWHDFKGVLLRPDPPVVHDLAALTSARPPQATLAFVKLVADALAELGGAGETRSTSGVMAGRLPGAP